MKISLKSIQKINCFHMIYYLLSLIILNNKRKKLNNKVLSVCISSISNRLYFISGNFLNENKIIYMQKKKRKWNNTRK